MATPKKTRSKFVRAFVEGNTVSDGRTVTAQMIDQIEATFNAETYSPRINVEHLKGYSPEPPFNGYGDVFAVRAQTDEIAVGGKTEKRRALYCQVDANDQLVKLAGTDQKPYPSVEITDSYAGTGKFGLVGLAFTDSPASIATQRLSFSRSAPGTVRAAGEDEVMLEFEAAPIDPTDTSKAESAIAGFFAALTAKFSTGKSEPKPEDVKPVPANDNFDVAAFTTAIGETVGQSIAAAVKPVAEAQAAFQRDLTALQEKVEGTEKPGQFQRKPASGGSAMSGQIDF